jgi:3-hydroxyisobutyrate dehydrogenase
MLETIAFIGLGNMGGPMAANLVNSGYPVRGFDLAEPAREAATASGITLCETAAQTLTGSSIVITMLPAGHHVLSVWSDLVESVDKGTLMIDCSTIDVECWHPDFHGRGRGGRFEPGPTGAGSDGATGRPLRFGRCRPGCQDLQQHDPWDHHGRGL